MALLSKTAPGSSTRLHPPYFQMISDALNSLKDRNGSSQPAIADFLQGNYTKLLPPNFKKILSVQLKKFAKSDKLVKIKNSYKISSSEKAKLVAKSVKKATAARTSGNDKIISIGRPTNRKMADNDKTAKMKRLSQVNTPEGLKKRPRGISNVKGPVTAGKMKRLSQVKTPEALKRRKAASATLPVKMRLPPKPSK